VRAVEQTEYIVQCIRDSGSMYEDDARAFLAEHDAGVRADALAEGAELLRRQAGLRLRRPEHSAGLRQGAVLLTRAADRPAAEAPAGFFQPGHTYRSDQTKFLFHCVTHTLWPDDTIRALGRSAWTDRPQLHWIATELAEADWTGNVWGGWVDVTGEVTP
jgi:hypothetical protein